MKIKSIVSAALLTTLSLSVNAQVSETVDVSATIVAAENDIVLSAADIDYGRLAIPKLEGARCVYAASDSLPTNAIIDAFTSTIADESLGCEYFDSISIPPATLQCETGTVFIEVNATSNSSASGAFIALMTVGFGSVAFSNSESASVLCDGSAVDLTAVGIPSVVVDASHTEVASESLGTVTYSANFE